MAELFGIVVSGINLVSLGHKVSEIFQKTSTWRHPGKDYEHFILQLNLSHIAYHRWQKTVKLVEPETTADHWKVPTASTHEAETVGMLLGAIVSAFRDAEKTSQRYETAVEEDMPLLGGLEARVRAVVKAGQAGSEVLQGARWVVHDGKALQILSERVTANVQNLVDMLPSTTHHIQEKLAILDIQDLIPSGDPDERKQLVELSSAAGKVDQILQKSAEERIEQMDRRHKYSDMRVAGNAQMINGDELAAGHNAPEGSGHTYRGCAASGNAQMLNGDRVGMPDFFGGEPFMHSTDGENFTWVRNIGGKTIDVGAPNGSGTDDEESVTCETAREGTETGQNGPGVSGHPYGDTPVSEDAWVLVPRGLDHLVK